MTKNSKSPKSAAEAQRRLAVVPDSVCACGSCQEMCERRPCWTTPAEAQAIIDAGLGGRLMRDWWVGAAVEMPDDDERRWDDTFLLVPAMVGHEGGDCDRSWMPKGRCTFLKGGRCELHALGLKPSEGRKAIHEPQWSETITDNLHQLCAATWATKDAQRMVADWQSAALPVPITTTPAGQRAENND